MVNVECFIVFCSSRLGRVLVISIRQFAKAYPTICESLSADLRKPICRFAKAYLPICKKRCKVISFSPYNDAVPTHFNFASDRTRCLLAFYNNCVITQFPQHLQSVTSTLLPHRSPIPIPFVPSPYPFCPIPLSLLPYLSSLPTPPLPLPKTSKAKHSTPLHKGRGRATHWVARGRGFYFFHPHPTLHRK